MVWDETDKAAGQRLQAVKDQAVSGDGSHDVFSVAGAVFLYNFVFRGRFANVVVGFLHHIVYAGETDAYERARQTYQHVIRNYLDWYFGGRHFVFVCDCPDDLYSLLCQIFYRDQPRH